MTDALQPYIPANNPPRKYRPARVFKSREWQHNGWRYQFTLSWRQANIVRTAGDARELFGIFWTRQDGPRWWFVWPTDFFMRVTPEGMSFSENGEIIRQARFP